MVKSIEMIYEIGLFILIVIFRICYINKNNTSTSQNTKAIIICNGPSLKNDINQILDNTEASDIYCVNYMALDNNFQKLKPNTYVFADPMFWSKNVKEDVKKDNDELVRRLLQVNWNMRIICPKDGVTKIRSLLEENEKLNIEAVPQMGVNFTSEYLNLLAYKLNVGTPIFVNVAILALWDAVKKNKKLIDIYGVDFSFFKQYSVDQSTNELYHHYSHFYQKGTTQFKPAEKYQNQSQKKMHTRMHQAWQSFQQMYLISLYAKKLKIKILNRSSNSYLDCFERG